MAGNGRTLVFSFDGTGNEPSDAKGFEHDESISNILKLHVLMGGGLSGRDRTKTRTDSRRKQITYYYNGIGTRENGGDIPLVGWLVAKVTGMMNSALAPGWGDAGRILNEAMDDLEEQKSTPEDKIVVFGFSRGAALARQFASKLLAKNKKLEIAFLGVFDTVAAMNGIHRRDEKISSDVVFENGTVHKHVKRAVHILSLDENRIAFEPTQMNQNTNRDSERIHEIWFLGVHSDIGGGYWHDGLSDIALQYMINECQKALESDIKIEDKLNADEMRKWLNKQGDLLKILDADDILIHPNVTGVPHAHTEGLGRIYSKQVRNVCVRKYDKALQTSRRRPLVHHSVKARFDLVPEYRPPALRGLDFDLLDANNDHATQIKGIEGLRTLPDERDIKERRRG